MFFVLIHKFYINFSSTGQRQGRLCHSQLATILAWVHFCKCVISFAVLWKKIKIFPRPCFNGVCGIKPEEKTETIENFYSFAEPIPY